MSEIAVITRETPEEQWRAKIEELKARLAREKDVVSLGKAAGLIGALRVTKGMRDLSSIGFAIRELGRQRHCQDYAAGVALAFDAFVEATQGDPIDRAIVRAGTNVAEEAPVKRKYGQLVGMHIGLRVRVIAHLGPERYLCQCVCGHEWERAGPTLRNSIDMGTPAWCPAKCVSAERKTRK